MASFQISNSFNRTLCLGLALTAGALLACKASGEKEEPPKAAAATPTAATAAPTAETAELERPAGKEPERSGKPQLLTSEEVSSRLKQTMQGHKAIPEQSFALTVAGLGDISVLSSMSPNGSELVFHVYDEHGKRTQSLLNKNASAWNATKLLAVSFPDIDGDGNQDFIALASYSPLDGHSGAFNSASVFTRPGGGRFVFDAQRSERASQGSPTSVVAAARAAR
jgi:hypothetical protein